MSNETNNTPVEEPIKKTSKLKKLGRNMTVAGIYAIPVAATAASCYYSWKLISMNLETAKLQLEAAKNAAQQ
jgi:hypothetical protein